MNKSELIDAIAATGEFSKKAAATAWEAVAETITGALSRGDSVQLVGFGTFVVREYGARKGRNPATGEDMEIKARKAPVFKAGKFLKEAVNQNKKDKK